MAEALQHAVHVARVGEVLQAGYTIAVHLVILWSLFYSANLPFCNTFHLGSALRLVEAQVPSLAALRTVRSSQAVALDCLLHLGATLPLKILSAKSAGVVRCQSKLDVLMASGSGRFRFRIYSF
jgi:hypothetical protein